MAKRATSFSEITRDKSGKMTSAQNNRPNFRCDRLLMSCEFGEPWILLRCEALAGAGYRAVGPASDASYAAARSRRASHAPSGILKSESRPAVADWWSVRSHDGPRNQSLRPAPRG